MSMFAVEHEENAHRRRMRIEAWTLLRAAGAPVSTEHGVTGVAMQLGEDSSTAV